MSLRRTLWLSLVLILVLALAACGAKPTTGGAESGAAQSTPQPTAQRAAASNPTDKPATQAQPTAAATEPATAAAAKPTAAAGEATVAPVAATAGSTAQPAGATGDPEPNTAAEALAIEPGKTSGTLLEDDEDWFTFHVPASAIMTFVFTPAAGASPMQAILQDAEGYELWRVYDVKAPMTKSYNRVHAGAEGADYAVNVLGGLGAYAIEVTFESQDDAGSGVDSGDTIASATPISTSTVITGMVGDLDTDDMYEFDVKAGTVLSLTFSAADDSSGKQAILLDSEGYELWRVYDVTTRAKTLSLILSADDAGAYYMHVMGEKGLYRFEVATVPQDDAGSGKDAGDKPSSAVAVELGKSYTGLIGDHDEYDLFKFEADGGSILDISISPADDAKTMRAVVMDADQYELWQGYDIAPGSDKSFSHVLDANAGGTFYVAVADGRGTYTLDLVAGAQNDAGSGKDAGDKPASAILIEPGASNTGQVGGSDTEDLFKFEVEGGEIISLTFTPAEDAEPISVALWDPDLYELWSEYGVGPGVEKTYTYVVGSDLGGTYYLWVGDPADQDSYTFEVKITGQDDAGSGGDAGDTPRTAVDVEPDVEFSGLVGNEDVEDYYRFEPEVGQVIVITGGPDADGLHASVLDGDEYSLWEEYDIGHDDSVEYEIEVVEGETPYYLQISGDAGTYAVIIEPAP